MKHKERFLIITIAALLILVNVSGFTIGSEEQKANGSRGTHTVLAELGAATTCPYCPAHENYIQQLSGDYYVVTLACSHYSPYNGYNQDIIDRLLELGMSGYPTSFWDGGYTSVSGQSSVSALQNAYDTCAARTVADVDIDLEVYWLGGAEMQINVDVINFEGSTYNGRLRIYILEIESRWNNYNGQPYFNALLSMPYDNDINVGSTSTFTHSFNWDGNDHGYGDITSDNILVVASVFDQSTDYTDETAGAYPTVTIPPTALFSFYPDYVEVGENIYFTDESYDPDGFIVSWSWDFGDGNSSSDVSPVHSYAQPGDYLVSLTVVDNDDLSDSYSAEVIVTNVGESIIVNQNIFDRGFRMMPGWDAYQEFIPTVDELSRVELYMTKSGSPTGDVTIQIRQDNADGAIVFEGSISPDDVLTSFPDYVWVNVDLGGVPVTSGNTYVIVLLSPADGAGTHHNLQWGWCDSYPANSGGPYDGGWFYFRKDFSPSWSFVRDWDFTFRSYGYE